MRILVVGTGSIGRRHIRVIKSTGMHELAVCDVNRRSAEEVASEQGISRCFYDFREALNAGCDAVFVCTPNAFHREVTVAALEQGCDVFVEKPIAHTVEDGIIMVEAAKRSGKALMVGYTLRVYPGFEDVKRILDEDVVGKPVYAHVYLSAAETLVVGRSDYRQSYATGGGIIYDYSHEIDYLRYYFGDPVRYACLKTLSVKMGKTCDDIAESIFQFKNGVIAGVHMDYIQECGNKKNGRTIEIVCEKGIVNYDFNGGVRVRGNDGTNRYTKYACDTDGLFLKQFHVFEAVCAGQNTNYVHGEDGLAVLQICQGLYQSDMENKIMLV